MEGTSDDNSLDDDVFEVDTTINSGGEGNLRVVDNPVGFEVERKPSPTGYRDYQPPIEVFQLITNKEDNALFSNQQEYEPVIQKTILLGDSGVGKTSLLVKFDTGKFHSGTFSATVGIGFTNKTVNVDGGMVKLQIWDTAGQERFRSITHAYYRDAHALLLLYDITNKTSFDNIRAWLSEIHEYAQDDVVIMLIGNKADCESSTRVIRRVDGERLAREYKAIFIETSAKNGQNVDLAFTIIAKELIKCQAKEANTLDYKSDNERFRLQDYIRQRAQQHTCPPCIYGVI